MPDRDEWRALIESKYETRPAPVIMSTFLDRFGSASQPVKMIGDDGRTYLVKGRQNGRMVVNEQIVGMLGVLLGAPVPPPMLVDVPPALVAIEPRLNHLEPGISHATVWIDNCTDRQGIA